MNFCNIEIKNQPMLALTYDEIAGCFPVLQELRPSLKNLQLFAEQILRQNKQGYTLIYLKDGSEVAACMGFRIFETLAWSKILYIDDLITREQSRKKGFGKVLLEYAVQTASLEKCCEVHLDSGHQRNDAHRLYLNMGFTLSCHHFSLLI